MSRPMVRVGDAMEEARSGFASGQDIEEGLVQVRMNNVTTDGKLNWSKLRRVPAPSRLEGLLLEPGDVLFNATNSPELVGKSAFFPGYGEPVTFSNHFLRLKTKPGTMDARYFAHWLNRQFHLRKFQSLCKQWVNQATVSRDTLLSLSIPLPPLDEQRRIAAILDQAEELRAKRRAALALLDQLPQAIFLEMFGDPVTNPQGWPTQKIETLCKLVRGSSPRPQGDARFFGGPVPRLMIADITRDGLLVTPRIDSLTQEGASRSRAVKAGTIAMAVSGNIGLVSRVAVDACIHDGFVAFMDLDESRVRAGYLLHYLNQAKSLHDQNKAGAIFINIKTGDIKALAIPVPTIKAQDAFITKVEAVDHAKTDHQSALVDLDALSASLQVAAFATEFIEHNPTGLQPSEGASNSMLGSSPVIDSSIKRYRDTNIESLQAALKAIEFPDVTKFQVAIEAKEWSSALSRMLARQSEMSSLLGKAFTTPPKSHQVFGQIGQMHGIAKVIEDALLPSRKLTELLDQFKANHFSGIDAPFDSIRRLTVANSLDTSVAQMMAGFTKHQAALETIAKNWRNSKWDEIQRSSQLFERLQALSLPNQILEIGSLERFNAVNLLRSTTHDLDWAKEPETTTAIEIVRTEYLDSVEAGLKAIDPRLLTMFQGAKLAAKSTNADRARHVAVSLREMTTHLLHILAPNDAISSWSTSESDYSNGKPTRACRIRFIYSRYGTEVLAFFEGDIKEALRWIELINSQTHSLDGFESDGAIEALIARFEGLALALIRGSKGFE